MTKNYKLGDVASFIRGITFTPEDVASSYDGKNIGCMRTKNVQEQLDLKDVWYLDESFVRNKEQFLQEGDLLVSTANSWNLVGKACWVPSLNYPCTFGGFISVLRADENKINKKFLYHWFTAEKNQALIRSFGQKTTNISNLNLKRALDMKINLPAIDEQNQIVEKLDFAEKMMRLHDLGRQKAHELLTVMQKNLLELA